jgi:hypothetical protein
MTAARGSESVPNDAGVPPESWPEAATGTG